MSVVIFNIKGYYLHFCLEFPQIRSTKSLVNEYIPDNTKQVVIVFSCTGKCANLLSKFL